jgi:hypothetical protein
MYTLRGISLAIYEIALKKSENQPQIGWFSDFFSWNGSGNHTRTFVRIIQIEARLSSAIFLSPVRRALTTRLLR